MRCPGAFDTQGLMQKLFTHENRLIVYNIRNLLQEQGIECTIRNEFSGGGVGDLSPFETWPELWLVDERDQQRALEIIDSLQHADEREINCPACGESNARSFKLCWNCGSLLDDD